MFFCIKMHQNDFFKEIIFEINISKQSENIYKKYFLANFFKYFLRERGFNRIFKWTWRKKNFNYLNFN
jgi:hypothetical protein